MVKSITPKDLKARLDAGDAITVIDVREDWELQTSAVRFAKHIPMDEIVQRIEEVPKDSDVVFLCKSGARSGRVAEYFVGQGYKNVANMQGGILQWAADVDPTLPRFY